MTTIKDLHSEAQAALRDKKSRHIVYVRGNTYPIRAKLCAAGFVWRGGDREWVKAGVTAFELFTYKANARTGVWPGVEVVADKI
jgi:hypothetical protein